MANEKVKSHQLFISGAERSAGVPKSFVSLRGVVAQRRLTSTECNNVINTALSFSSSPIMVVGNAHLPKFRQGIMRSVPPTPETIWIYELLMEIAEEENDKHFKLDLAGITRKPEFVEYKARYGRFNWHDDYSHEDESAPRKLTVVFQLSDGSDYKGGDFQSWSVPIDTLSRERGSVLVLPSFVPHRVTPVTKGIRRILVAWISGPRLR